MNILLTGGSGLLGSQLIPILGKKRDWKVIAPPHKLLDITQAPITSYQGIDLLIHCAAYTKVEQAEIDRQECFETNVNGTFNLLLAYPKVPFVFISTEYAHRPINFYSLTKRLAEHVVTYQATPYLIIRTLFKPRPFPHPKAFTDMFTLGDYADKIASKIYYAISEWQEDKKSKLIYIGTGRKSMFELAKETRPDVEPMSIKDIKTVKLPSDYQ